MIVYGSQKSEADSESRVGFICIVRGPRLLPDPTSPNAAERDNLRVFLEGSSSPTCSSAEDALSHNHSAYYCSENYYIATE